MITIKLDETLKKKLDSFAEANNLQTEVLIETILYEYIDEIEQKQGPISLAQDDEDEEFNQADIDYLSRSMGLDDSLKK